MMLVSDDDNDDVDRPDNKNFQCVVKSWFCHETQICLETATKYILGTALIRIMQAFSSFGTGPYHYFVIHLMLMNMMLVAMMKHQSSFSEGMISKMC